MGIYGSCVQILTQMSISILQSQNSTPYLASENFMNLRNDLEIIMNSKVHCQGIRSTVASNVNSKGRNKFSVTGRFPSKSTSSNAGFDVLCDVSLIKLLTEHPVAGDLWRHDARLTSV